VGLLVVPILVAILGAALEMGFLRFIYKADPLYQLLLTYGLVLIMSDVVKLIWGAENQSGISPPRFQWVGGHFRPVIPQL
jgi:branched-chain amino acid transport system permease protein